MSTFINCSGHLSFAVRSLFLKAVQWQEQTFSQPLAKKDLSVRDAAYLALILGNGESHGKDNGQ